VIILQKISERKSYEFWLVPEAGYENSQTQHFHRTANIYFYTFLIYDLQKKNRKICIIWHDVRFYTKLSFFCQIL